MMTDQQDRRSRGSNFPSRLENPTSKIQGGTLENSKVPLSEPDCDGNHDGRPQVRSRHTFQICEEGEEGGVLEYSKLSSRKRERRKHDVGAVW